MMDDAVRKYLKWRIDELDPADVRNVLAFVSAVVAVKKDHSSMLHREGGEVQ